MYQALYRKYRPRSFSDVVGQEHITETLRRQIETGRTSHAYLFVGTRGTGKTTCAKILSRALNCEHPLGGDPCNECAACRGIESGAIMDVVEIDAASNNGVDSIRQIRDEAVYTPASVKKRVYIVDEVHMLSTSAFNALLKILEEPPEHLVFILATTELRKIPATILSRCQRFSFKRLTSENIQKRLKYVSEQEGFTLTDGAAALLSRLADGAMRDALSLLDQCLTSDTVDEDTVMAAVGLLGTANTAALWEQLSRGDIPSALKLFENAYYGGADPASVLSDILSLSRDMMMIKVAPEGSRQLLSGAFSAEKLSALSAGIPSARLLLISETLQDSLSSMATVRDKRTAAEICLIKLSGILSGSFASTVESAPQALPSAPVPPVEKNPPISQKRYEAPKAPVFSSPAAEKAPAPWEDMPEVSVKDSPAPPMNNTFSPPAPDYALPEDSAPTPWDDEEPPEDTIAWGNVPTDDNAPPEPETINPASAPSEDEWWDKVLKICSSHVEGTSFTFLSDKLNLVPELSGNRLVLHAANAFVLMMVNTPAVKSAVSQAASGVLGQSISVDAVEGIERKALDNDKLDALARFGNIKFE